jgi:hypothetical protein
MIGICPKCLHVEMDSHSDIAMHLFPLATAITLSLGSIGHASPATIDFVGCGSGCKQTITQLSPVSRTAGGYPRVLVTVKTVISPSPEQRILGHDRSGDPIIEERGTRFPKSEKYWIIADCLNKRVSLYSKHSDGLDAGWVNAYEYGEPNNCHSACGRAYDQWYLLCRAAGEI